MGSFTTEAFSLLGVGLAVIALRTYSRLLTVGIRGLQADDYLMILAAAVYSVETYLAFTIGEFWHGLANNGMTSQQRAALAPYSPEWWLRVNGSKTHVAGWTVYTFLLWIMKAAMCTFYLRLTDNLKHFKIRVYIGFVLILATWVAVTLSLLLGCRPFEKNWQINPDPGNFCQPALSKINIFVTVVLNVLTDLYLLSIPIPLLWQANLPKPKKISLMVLFGAGIFVTMAGILRCVLILSDPVNGAKEAGVWGVRETFVAVITSNIPMIYPLARRVWGSGLLGTVPSSLSGSRAGLGTGKSRSGLRPVPGAVRLEHHPAQRASHAANPSHFYPAKGFDSSVSESQEYIYESFMGGGRGRQQHRLLGSNEGKIDDTGRQTGSAGSGNVPTGYIKKEVTLEITLEDRDDGGGNDGSGRGTPMGLRDEESSSHATAASDYYHRVAFGGPQGRSRETSSSSRTRPSAAEPRAPAAAVWARDGDRDSLGRDSFTFITHNAGVAEDAIGNRKDSGSGKGGGDRRAER